jgi:hypothetical protein
MVIAPIISAHAKCLTKEGDCMIAPSNIWIKQNLTVMAAFAQLYKRNEIVD